MNDIPQPSWTSFKTLLTSKGGITQYNEFSNYYQVFFFEGAFRYTVDLYKDGGTDVTDFETTYKSSANAADSLAKETGHIASVDSKLGSLGQKTMAGSAPVVIASNQAAIPVTITGDTINVSENIAQWGGTNTTLGQKVSSSSVPMVIASDQSSIPVAATQSGTWSVRLEDGAGNNLTSQVNGSQRALDVGIDVAGVQVDPRSIRSLTSADVVTANAGTGNFTVTQATAANLNATISGTVTANIGTTNGLALDSTVSGLEVSQGSATSGQKGSLIQGAVTTSAPSYTTAQTNPLSLTTSGALRTDASATTQPISAASLPLPSGASTAANQTTANTSLSSIDGKLSSLGQKASASSVPVVIASDQSSVTISGTVTANQGLANATPWNENIVKWGGTAVSIGQQVSASSVPIVPASDYIPPSTSDISANGTIGALNATFPMSIHGCSSALLVLAGTWVGNVQIQGLAPDAATWSNLSTQPVPAGSGTFSTTVLTANGVYRVLAPADYTQIRALMSAYTSGTATVYFVAGQSVAIAQAVQLSAGNLNAQITGIAAEGAAIPANPILIGGEDTSNNLQPLQTDLLGDLIVVGSVASATTDSGNPVKVGSKYNSTLPAITTGQRADLQSNAFGELAVTNRNKYSNIHGNATTTIKSGAGRLHTMTANAAAGGTTVTIYDNTAGSGTTIASIATPPSGAVYVWDVEFSTGLTVVTGGSGATDITVSYY